MAAVAVAAVVAVVAAVVVVVIVVVAVVVVVVHGVAFEADSLPRDLSDCIDQIPPSLLPL